MKLDDYIKEHHNGNLTYFEVAVEVIGCGGVVIEACHIIGGVTGVTKSANENYMAIHDNHFAVSKSAVIVKDDGSSSNHNQINHNFVIMFDNTPSYTGDFIGFDIASNNNTIIGNETLRTSATRNRTGVVLRGLGVRTSTQNIVSSNRFNAMNTGVIIEAGSTKNDILDNYNIGLTRDEYLVDGGSNTRYRGVDSSSAFATSPLHEFNSKDGLSFSVIHTQPGAASEAQLQAVSHVANGVPRLVSIGVNTNIDLEIRPKGTGLLKFGDQTLTPLTIDGYITIKDVNGTTIRLATVS